MPDSSPIHIFDGHNDALLALSRSTRGFFERSSEGHIDLPRARAGGLGGGFCAVFVSPEGTTLRPADPDQDAQDALDAFNDEATMPPSPELGYSLRTAMSLTGLLFRLERESGGHVKVVTTAAEIRSCLENGTFAALLHFEGAEAIDPGLDALEVFYRAGLRSLGIVWSRPNAFGHGVPFKFPSTPDTGPGLTDAGKELVRRCNGLRVMIDLSHLNENGFWDVARLSSAPLVATHSNAHALSPSARNLTDKQLAAIAESDGMVGINFHVGFLREDGAQNADTPLDVMVRHVDYLVDRLGVDRVGLGSDFDGATMPREIGDAAGLPNLLAALRTRGYDDAALRKIAYQNWLRVLERTWGA